MGGGSWRGVGVQKRARKYFLSMRYGCEKSVVLRKTLCEGYYKVALHRWMYLMWLCMLVTQCSHGTCCCSECYIRTWLWRLVASVVCCCQHHLGSRFEEIETYMSAFSWLNVATLERAPSILFESGFPVGCLSWDYGTSITSCLCMV